MRSKIHDTRIEERIAAFDRVGHGDAVALRRQQVARQQMRSFEILASLKMSYPPNISSAPSPVSITLQPLSRATLASRNSGAGAVRNTGVSACHTTSGKTRLISSWEQRIST